MCGRGQTIVNGHKGAIPTRNHQVASTRTHTGPLHLAFSPSNMFGPPFHRHGHADKNLNCSYSSRVQIHVATTGHVYFTESHSQPSLSSAQLSSDLVHLANQPEDQKSAFVAKPSPIIHFNLHTPEEILRALPASTRPNKTA